jgi:hypothetical protein
MRPQTRRCGDGDRQRMSSESRKEPLGFEEKVLTPLGDHRRKETSWD